MARHDGTLRSLAALSVAALACNTAYADRISPRHHQGNTVAQGAAESPYQIELIGQNGIVLDTYRHHNRFYVLGNAGDRYTIRVTNPTSRRVEAVISVDGLDVIDGRSADLRKRGYVVPPHGELRVDGFRVSTSQVATFRFSSVSNSYAGRKGKARNVGVIGVAIFEERRAPEVILADPASPGDWRRGKRRRLDRSADEGDDGDFEIQGTSEAEATGSGTRPGTRRSPAPARSKAPAPRDLAGSAADSRAPSAEPAAPRVARKRASRGALRDRVSESRSTRCCRKPRERPGLGTEFGERRNSAATWTRFVRANPTRPDAMAELRYNNALGLQALGIQLEVIDDDELATRETANPFPGDRFAQPPGN